MYRINSGRALEISRAIASVGLNNIIKLEEADPQYRCLKNLYARVGDRAFILAVSNALISYMLSCSGEEYWCEFSNVMGCLNETFEYERLPEIFESFITKTRCNKFLRIRKLVRIKRFLSMDVAKEIYREPTKYCNDLVGLLKRLTVIGRGYSKTVVFSIKIYYYLCRISGIDMVPSKDIPIPCDRRVATLTLMSGLVSPANGIRDLKSHIEDLMTRYKSVVVRGWQIVSKESCIPPLNIDSVLWLTYPCITRSRSAEEFIECFRSRYGDFIGEVVLARLFNELTYLYKRA